MNDIKRTPAITTGKLDNNLLLNFANGKTLALDITTLSEELKTEAIFHGLKQKLCDAAAISCNPETGKPATVEDKYQAVLEVYNRLVNDGGWNKTRESGAGGGSGGQLFRALCIHYEGKRTPEEIRAFLETKTAQEKTALRGNPKIAAIIATLKPQKEAGIDSDELLAAL